MSGAFRELDAYRRARALAADVYEAVMTWQSLEQWSVGIQLIRAADSVAANIAEASGRWHANDRRRLYWVARGSLRETEHWLLCAEERGLGLQGTSDRVEAIARPLNGLIKKESLRPGVLDP